MMGPNITSNLDEEPNFSFQKPLLSIDSLQVKVSRDSCSSRTEIVANISASQFLLDGLIKLSVFQTTLPLKLIELRFGH
jgi:hypothetical protein